jgi:hypothetical protein
MHRSAIVLAIAFVCASCDQSQDKWQFVIFSTIPDLGMKTVFGDYRTLEECSEEAIAYFAGRPLLKNMTRGHPLYVECRLNCRIPHRGAECEREVMVDLTALEPPAHHFSVTPNVLSR